MRSAVAAIRLPRWSLTAHDERPDVLTAGVGFIADLPRREAIELLGRRVAALEEWSAEVAREWKPPGAPEEWGHIGEVVRLWVHRAVGGAERTRDPIERLERGAYVIAGEGERSAEVLPEAMGNPYAEHPHDRSRG
ncbi:hypothetical protein [Streptomyces sp. CNQ085]|uniref:hypothetical protein n=1 Tax=Streptomyces sp. CNQ085 TaxID=2886944 RepID=UPI001F50A62F|nr:hypothetical protein [Streptomyces sp. CNQ085]MCI0383397.1 hypothetical protein [Streptomyces sp. CNQ085]